MLFNRLLSVENNYTDNSVEFRYDANGRRLRKTVVASAETVSSTDYIYSGMQCLEERSASTDAMQKQYVWGLYVDELLQIKLSDGTKYYPLQDLLYRTSVLTDANQEIAESYEYTPYGLTTVYDSEGAVKTTNPICEYIFTGRQLDSETGLYFYRARYYSPELGRFLSKDPVDYKDSMNLYVYCICLPVTKMDWNGHQSSPANPPATSHKNFIDYALEKMIDLYNNHNGQTGSQSGENGKEKTDCITYVIQVLEYAFNKVGDPNAARIVRQKGRMGTELAKYLIETKGWNAIYWNPDTCNQSCKGEHSYSYIVAKKQKTYYNLPIVGLAVNYQPLPGSKASKDESAWQKLTNIRFGVGLGGGGWHTWPFTAGMVYEVHWQATSTGKLYDRGKLNDITVKDPLTKYWGSGIIVYPKN